MSSNSHVVRDILHGYVSFDNADRAIIDTAIVQRLRHVRQNDVAGFVFPSLNTTRFEHSLGVLHLADRLAKAALENCSDPNSYLSVLEKAIRVEMPDPRATFYRAARWYGLLHDIGHLPFSHLTEHCLQHHLPDLYPDPDFTVLHEAAGAYIVSQNAALNAAFSCAGTSSCDLAAAEIVTQLLSSKETPEHLQPLKDIVDADVDADRIDATARDGLMAGGDYGNYDIARLCRHAVLWEDKGLKTGKRWRVSFTTRAESAVESLLVQRVNTYRWIHYKPKVVAFKNAFRHCLAHLKLEATVWHAKQYESAQGYLDDAWVWSRLGSLPKELPEHVAFARDALLRRADTVRPLWKRRDGFSRLSTDIAEMTEESIFFGALSKKTPALNFFARGGVDKLPELEQRLNKNLSESGLGDRCHFLIFQQTFKPFSALERQSAGDADSYQGYKDEHDKVGSYHLVRYSDGEPVRLTESSPMVRCLRDVVRAEPSFGVTLIVPPGVDKATLDSLRKTFKATAADLLTEAAREMGSEQQAMFIEELAQD